MCCFSSCVMVYFPGPELDQHEDRKLRERFNALFDVYWKQYVKKRPQISLQQQRGLLALVVGLFRGASARVVGGLSSSFIIGL